MTEISDLLRQIYRGYAQSVGLDPMARYIHGNYIRPVVPLDTGVGGVFILGAYPSARFAVLDGITNCPVADNLGPFEPERWFDGLCVCEQPSARELEEFFLQPLQLARSGCWISDLVKVFLFKPGHVERYNRLGKDAPAGYLRESFFDIGMRSLPWIMREIELARPKLLITLGSEVAGILRGVHSSKAQIQLLNPRVDTFSLEGLKVPTIHCAHPGILMRPGPRNKWPEQHLELFVPAIRQFLASSA